MTVRVTRAALTGEIEFAIAYLRACNPGRDLTSPEVRREFAEMIVAQIFERAAAGLSGMQVLPAQNTGDAAGTSPLPGVKVALATPAAGTEPGHSRPAAGGVPGPWD